MPTAVCLNIVTSLYVSSGEGVYVKESEGNSYVSICSYLNKNVVYVGKVNQGIKVLSVNTAVLRSCELKALVSAECTACYVGVGNSGSVSCVPFALGFKIVVNVFVCVFCGESNILGNRSTEIILCTVLVPTKEFEGMQRIKSCRICRNSLANLKLNYGILLGGSIIKGNAISRNVIIELQYERAIKVNCTGNACFLSNIIFDCKCISSHSCIDISYKSLGAVKLVLAALIFDIMLNLVLCFGNCGINCIYSYVACSKGVGFPNADETILCRNLGYGNVSVLNCEGNGSNLNTVCNEGSSIGDGGVNRVNCYVTVSKNVRFPRTCVTCLRRNLGNGNFHIILCVALSFANLNAVSLENNLIGEFNLA